LMVTAKRPRARPPKRDRVRAHIEELKRLVLSEHPEARVDVGPVPETTWPGLYVYADIDDHGEEELRALVSQAQEKFFQDEWMTVYVFVRRPNAVGS